MSAQINISPPLFFLSTHLYISTTFLLKDLSFFSKDDWKYLYKAAMEQRFEEE